MSLFELPKRTNNDKDLIKKVKNSKPMEPQLKLGKDSLLTAITNIKVLVESKLGKYKDRYKILISDEDIKLYIDKCIENGICSLDTETTGLNPLVDKIVSIQLKTPGMQSIYIPLRHISYINQEKAANQANEDFVISQIKRLAENNVKIIYTNAKFDWKMILENWDIDLPIYWDTMLVSKLLDNTESAALKYQYAKYIEHSDEYAKFSELFDTIPIQYVPISTAYIYGAKDPEMTFELYEFQLKALEDKSKVKWVAENIEFPCIKATAMMELNGVLLDFPYIEKLKEKYNKLLKEAEEQCYKDLEKYNAEIDSYRKGHINCKLENPINLSSPNQLATLFYDILKVGVIDKKSPRGTGVDILEKIKLPFAKSLVKYREIAKLISTYIEALPEQAQADGRIHCNFNQYGTDTGRFSSSEPNLQNIPSHNTDIRPMFIASPGNILLGSDFSQQEVRIMAAMSKDPNMIKAYKENKDIYAWVASLIYKKPYEDCKEFYPDGKTNKEGKQRRSNAKAIVLGINYSKGPKSISEDLGISEQEAQNIYDTFFKEFPAVKDFITNTQNKIKKTGYSETLFGRRRQLPDMMLPLYEFTRIPGTGKDFNPLDFDSELKESDNEVSREEQTYYAKRMKNAFGFKQKQAVLEDAKKDGIIIKENTMKKADAERQCVNSVIQGTAGDMTKLSLIGIMNNQELKDLGFKTLITVHDEIIGECPRKNAKRCGELLTYIMSHSLDGYMDMKFKCDPSYTERWYGEEIQID